MVASRRIVFTPVVNVTALVVTVVHVVNELVAGKLMLDKTVEPFMSRLPGLMLVQEYRQVKVYVPAVRTFMLQLIPSPMAF